MYGGNRRRNIYWHYAKKHMVRDRNYYLFLCGCKYPNRPHRWRQRLALTYKVSLYEDVPF